MELTKTEALKRIKAAASAGDASSRNRITCALIGHSRIQTHCFGYYYCGRCGDQVGDSLGSVYPQASEVVVIGHNCKTCRVNYRKMTWQDKLYTPKPFPKKKAAQLSG